MNRVLQISLQFVRADPFCFITGVDVSRVIPNTACADLKTFGKPRLGGRLQMMNDFEIRFVLSTRDGTAKQIVKMNNLSNVRVKFLKDGVTQNADFTILTMSDGTYYGKLDFNSGLIRYLDSRFIDIELVTNSEVGLKIPVSSIVSKQFFTIPEEYATYGGNKKNIGFLKATADRGGNASTTFVQPTIYNKADGRYYVDDSVFREGDIVIRDGSTDRFIIRDRAVLEGVYCMNKGFAVFRKIVILDKNEDYCIVEKGTPYGIAQFDNIVENASSVKDSQITAQ